MKQFFNEFKQFIARGNVMDMAVGVIIGTAIGALPSVSNASISFMTQKLVLDADVPDADALDALLAEAQSVISRIEPDCVIVR